MTVPLWALAGYVLWTMLLVVAIGVLRVRKVLIGEFAPSGFPSGERHGSDGYWRLNRAHLNATENLAMFASVVLMGAFLGVDDSSINTLALVVLGARVAQSVAHVASGRSRVVNIRFAFFLAQLVALVLMLVRTVQLAMA